MPPIGETLREARLRRNVDIAEVSARTKIRTKYLRALESEEFDQLPGPTYVRTFLRTYAEYLGLDPHLLVEEYRRRYPATGEEESITPFAPVPVGRQRDGGGGRIPSGPPGSPGMLLGGLAAPLIVIFLLIGSFTEPTPEGGLQATTAASTRQEAAGPPEKAATEKQRTRKPVPDNRVELVVAPDGPTYLCVDDGRGNVVFQDTVDSPKHFRGRMLRINMGRAAGEVKVNGKPVKIEPGPDPVGYLFEPGKSEPIPDGERPCQ